MQAFDTKFSLLAMSSLIRLIVLIALIISCIYPLKAQNVIEVINNFSSSNFNANDCGDGNTISFGGSLCVTDLEGSGCSNCEGTITGNNSSFYSINNIDVSDYCTIIVTAIVVGTANGDGFEGRGQCGESRVRLRISSDGNSESDTDYPTGTFYSSVLIGVIPVSGNNLNIDIELGTQKRTEQLCIEQIIIEGEGTGVSARAREDEIIACEGEDIRLRLRDTQAGETYQWYRTGSPISGETGTELNINDAQTSDAGLYIVEIQNARGCSKIIEFEVFIESGGTGLISLEDVIVCAGERGRLRAKTQNIDTEGDFFYEWLDENGNTILSGTGEDVLDLGRLDVSVQGLYCVLVTDPNAICTPQDPVCAIVEILDGPGRVSSNETFVCTGERVRLQARTAGNGNYDYTWLDENGITVLLGLNEDVLDLGSPDEAVEMIYFVIIIDPNTGCISEGEFLVNVAKGPGRIQGIDEYFVCQGQSLTLDARPENNGTYQFEWTFPRNSPAAFTANDGSVTIPTISKEDEGLYFLNVLDNTTGCFSEFEVFVSVADANAEECGGTVGAFDCINATTINTNIYRETRSYTSSGNIIDEIKDEDTCLFDVDESGTIWYTFTTKGTGELAFLITPDILDSDLDWALFDLTNATCDDLSRNARALLVSCNAAGNPECHGITGIASEGMYDIQGGGCDVDVPNFDIANSPINAPVAVSGTKTFALAIQNWTYLDQNIFDGYTIDFSGSSVAIGDNPPRITNIENGTSICDDEPIILTFDQAISCQNISNLQVRLLAEDGQEYVGSAVSSDCLREATTIQTLTIVADFGGANAGNYRLIIENTVSNRVALSNEEGINMLLPVELEVNLPMDNSLDVSIRNRTPNADICAGESVRLEADTFLPDFFGNNSYTWRLNGNIIGTGSTIDVMQAGTYKVEIRRNGNSSNPACETGLGEYTLSGTTPNCDCPAIAAPQSNGSTNITICSDEAIPTLSMSTANLGPDNQIRWYDAATGGTLLAIGSNFGAVSAGIYYAEIYDIISNCSSPRTAISISIMDCDCPTPTLTIPNEPSCANDNRTYALRVNIAPENTLTATAGIIAGSSGFLTVYNIPVGQNITVTVTTPDECINSRFIQAPRCGDDGCPPLNVLIEGDTLLCPNERTTLTASLEGGNAASFQWNNFAASDRVNISAAGTYSVTVTDTNSCTAEASITVSESAIPTLNFLAPTCSDDGQTYSLRLNTDANTIVSVSVGTITGGAGMFTITNIPAGMPIIINVYNRAGCGITQVVDAPDCESNPCADASISGDLEVCEGERTVLTANGGVSYQWSNYAQSNKVGVLAGTYTVTVTDALGCETILTVIVVEIDCIENGAVASGQTDATTFNVQVQPNPFKEETAIIFQQTADDWVEIVLYDIAGRVLYQERNYYTKGAHQWKIDGMQLGESGIYFYRIQNGEQQKIGKLILQE